jgi:hypothetical protein
VRLSNADRGEVSRLARMLLALAGALVVFTTTAAAQATFPEEISLPTGFRPEGISIGNGSTFYVGSIPTGAIYRGDLRKGEGAVLVPGVAGRAAIGTKFDRGLLYVAGGPTGKGFVYEARTGVLLREVQLATGAGGTFVNDVVVTRRAAYFTDSQRPALYRLPLANDGTPGTVATVVPIAGGGFVQVPGENNLNGIDATRGREDARRRAVLHGEALSDRRGRRADDADRPRGRDGCQR